MKELHSLHEGPRPGSMWSGLDWAILPISRLATCVLAVRSQVHRVAG